MTPFTEKNLLKALVTQWLGKSFYLIDEVDSTNDWLLAKAASENIAHGAVVATHFQRDGKGRSGRSWVAEVNSGLIFSSFLRLNLPAFQASWLMMAAGLAVVEAVAEVTNLQLSLKWPNDIVITNSLGKLHKLGGILIESCWENDRLATAVLGIGLNVNMPASSLPPPHPNHLPATSLLLESKQKQSRLTLFTHILVKLEQHLDAIMNAHSPQPAWQKQLVWMGQNIQYQAQGNLYHGIVEGVDEWGRLLVRDNAGILNALSAVDVKAVRPYS